MTSNARALFDEIMGQADRFEYLSEMAVASKFETEWLDFKTPPQPDHVLRTWSEAVGGLANTAGGVVIFGIDCRQIDGIDASCGVKLVDDPFAFGSTLNRNINEATDPPVQGILIEIVKSPSENKGFVVCFVPESRNKPHRCEQTKKGKQYMIRCGESFMEANPSLLRSMFYPKREPRLSLVVEPHWSETIESIQNKLLKVRFTIALENNGHASAENVYLMVKNVIGGLGRKLDFSSTHGWNNTRVLGGLAGFTCDAVIHPSMLVGGIYFDILIPAYSSFPKHQLTPGVNVTILFKVCARDMAAFNAMVVFSADEIDRKESKVCEEVEPT